MIPTYFHCIAGVHSVRIWRVVTFPRRLHTCFSVNQPGCGAPIRRAAAGMDRFLARSPRGAEQTRRMTREATAKSERGIT